MDVLNNQKIYLYYLVHLQKGNFGGVGGVLIIQGCNLPSDCILYVGNRITTSGFFREIFYLFLNL